MDNAVAYRGIGGRVSRTCPLGVSTKSFQEYRCCTGSLMPEEDGGLEQDVFVRAVGNRIREIRKEQGLTQNQLAAKADLRQSYVFEIESGGSNLTLKMLNRVARALHVSPRDLLPSDQSATLSEQDLGMVRAICDRIVALLQQRAAEDETLLKQLREFTRVAAKRQIE